MSETCPHVWRVDDWTRDPASGRWVHADPVCMRPSPFTEPQQAYVNRRPRNRRLPTATR